MVLAIYMAVESTIDVKVHVAMGMITKISTGV